MKLGSAKDGIKTGDRTGVGFFIPLPPGLASQFPSLAPDDLSSPHVTFLYVGEVTEEREEEFLHVSQEAFKWLRVPVRATLENMDYFSHADKDRRVAHMTVQFNRDMKHFRDHLWSTLEDAGFEVQDSFPVYRPHVTLAYLDGMDSVYRGDVPQGSWKFRSIEVWGLPKEHEVRFSADPGRLVAMHLARRITSYKLSGHRFGWGVRSSFGPADQRFAKYKNKREDDEGNIHYEYGPRQVAERHKRKAEKAEKIRNSIGDLRNAVKSDLKDKDDKKQAVALAVALMDETYERVGNETSAEEGHFGVTGWRVKHVTFKGKKAIVNYIGKSGVKQSKEVTDASVVSALKEMTKGKDPEDNILTCGGEEKVCISASDVNEFLKDFDITAKDIRGFHANREMVERLKVLRKDGPDLPRARKEKDEILKKEFDEALKETAAAVGHQSSTLKSDYLVPSLVDSYLHDGTVIENFKQATKTHTEREDEESERLVRPEPKKKPPRKDKRRERMKDDKDPDLDTGDRGDDPDLSLNYKRVGSHIFDQSSSYIGTIIGERVGRDVGFFPQFSRDAETRREDMARRLNKEGAAKLIAKQDRIASLVQKEWKTLGLTEKMAHDIAYRTDLLSDYISKRAGIPVVALSWDVSQIAEQKSGPLEQDADESFMKGEFTQQEFSELREKQEAGKIPKVDKMAKLTKAGAAQVTEALDWLAGVYQNHHVDLGVPAKIALKYAEKLDEASDLVDLAVGITHSAAEMGGAAQPSIPPPPKSFDSTEISKYEPGGALQHDADEPYMAVNFTEQETSELSTKQVSGQLPQADSMPEQDYAGKLAAVAASLAEIAQGLQGKKATQSPAPSQVPVSDHGFNLFA